MGKTHYTIATGSNSTIKIWMSRRLRDSHETVSSSFKPGSFQSSKAVIQQQHNSSRRRRMTVGLVAITVAIVALIAVKVFDTNKVITSCATALHRWS